MIIATYTEAQWDHCKSCACKKDVCKHHTLALDNCESKVPQCRFVGTTHIIELVNGELRHLTCTPDMWVLKDGHNAIQHAPWNEYRDHQHNEHFPFMNIQPLEWVGTEWEEKIIDLLAMWETK